MGTGGINTTRQFVFASEKLPLDATVLKQPRERKTVTMVGDWKTIKEIDAHVERTGRSVILNSLSLFCWLDGNGCPPASRRRGVPRAAGGCRNDNAGQRRP
jgi:hypothetical protein